MRFEPPPGRFDPEVPDNPLVTILIADGVEVVEATASLRGATCIANLADSATFDDGRALIDPGGLRPVTRIGFTRGGEASTGRLMIQLGGVWHLPEPAGGVDTFAEYASDEPFPELIAEKILLTNADRVTKVESITFPSNVTLRLTDGGAPFFFQRGSLRPEPTRVPDFGEQLGLAARTVEPVGGVRAVDLVAHSDTFGTVTLDRVRVVSRVIHNALDGLTFEDRTRTVPAGGSAGVDLPVPTDLVLPEGRPAVASVALGLSAVGFGPTFAPMSVHHGAVVSAEFGVAQAVDVYADLTTSTLHLYLLRRTPKAHVSVELRGDVDGEPRGAVLAAALADAAGLPDGEFGWLAMTLASPLTVEAGTRLWMAVRADVGEVEWGGDGVPAGGLAALFSADRGNSWQPHPMTAAHLFVRDLPEPGAPLVARLRVGGEQQDALYDPAAFPLLLDAESGLVRGINALFGKATGGKAGTPLPGEIGLTLSADPPLPIQLTVTQFDVTYAQAGESTASLRGRPGNGRTGISADGDGHPGVELPDVLLTQPGLADAIQAGR